MIKDVSQCEPASRMKGDDRRAQILQTAVDLFSKRGFRGTTTKEIAIAAGVSEAIIFRHFATKDELWGAILEAKACTDPLHRYPWEGNEKLRKAMDDRDDFGVFYEMAVKGLNKHQADEGFMRLLFYSALEEHELAESFFGDFIDKIYEFLGSYIKTRQAEGAMREIDPRMVVRAFLGMVIHHSLNSILWDRKGRLMKVSNEEAAKNFAEIILRGVSS